MALTLSACGSSARSTKAFCSTLQQGAQHFKQQAGEIDQLTKRSAILGLVAAFANVGDYAQFLDKLNRVAPSEIQDDMNTVDQDFHDSINTSGSAAAGLITGNPAGFAELLFKALVHANSYKRVDEFASAQCGLSL